MATWPCEGGRVPAATQGVIVMDRERIIGSILFLLRKEGFNQKELTQLYKDLKTKDDEYLLRFLNDFSDIRVRN
jgi:hypothetical protein